jgi:hypothetical protein
VEGDTGLAITDFSDAGQDERPDHSKLADVLGPGLITGASDDDPSGIATYAQAGAAFGFALSWTLLLTYPLMCAIQTISGEIGRVTGKGIAANMRSSYPPLVLYALVGLLVLANVINIGADLGAMGAALQLILPGPRWLYVPAFAILIVLLEVFMRYASYVSVLRWLTLLLKTMIFPPRIVSHHVTGYYTNARRNMDRNMDRGTPNGRIANGWTGIEQAHRARGRIGYRRLARRRRRSVPPRHRHTTPLDLSLHPRR